MLLLSSIPIILLEMQRIISESMQNVKYCEGIGENVTMYGLHYEWPMIRHEQQTRKLQANLNSITLRSLNIRVNNGLKIITWNINSLRKRYPLLTALIAHEQPDILLLQETKVIEAEFDKLAPIPNYNVYRTGCIRFNGVDKHITNTTKL